MGQYFTNEKLPSNMQRRECFVRGHKFIFFTDNGVFSKDGLDFGSRLLLETIPLEEVGGKILDMGCGYGVFGIVLQKLTSAQVDMVDEFTSTSFDRTEYKRKSCGAYSSV